MEAEGNDSYFFLILLLRELDSLIHLIACVLSEYIFKIIIYLFYLPSMLLIKISQLKAALKLTKADKIKLLHQLTFDLDENRQDRKNLQNFTGFLFQLDSDEFKTKLGE